MSATTVQNNASAQYTALIDKLKEASLVESTCKLLSWDQETKMPPKGGAFRADQLKLFATLEHEMRTADEIGDLIAECEQDNNLNADARTKANLREIRRDYDQATRIPSSLIAELAECSSLGMDAWKDARAAEDFKKFLPWLEKTVELSRRKAECLGIPEGGAVLYDALLDQFEPGMTTARTVEIFKPLREFTVELVKKVQCSGVSVDTSAITREFPIEKQRELVRGLVEAIGYDFGAGRIDDAVHPFCETVGPHDVRLTNRHRADGWCDAISSGLHEAGHGVYEQGMPAEHYGEPLGSHISLGIHESQSRLWENLVGRSLPFWEWGISKAREVLGDGLAGVTPEQMYNAQNVVNPSFIRVEADEVTYNLHIMLRFDLERAMLHGDMSCADLPGIWNDRMKSDFGLDVPNDRLGCLQDIHWSMGAVGYFATYSFGNLYSAQLWEAMAKDIANRDELMRTGEFAPILGWLQEKIYSKGREFRAEELCQNITGMPLNHEALQRHLEAKVKAVYGV